VGGPNFRRARANEVRRRRTVAFAVLAAVALVVLLVAVLSRGGDDSAADPDGGAGRATAPALAQLPRGGRSILPEFRVVAYYGAPQSDELGELGIGSPDSAARRLKRQARAYHRPKRPVLPAMELIAVIANADAGEDGMYRSRQPDSIIRRYLRAARRHKALLLLDIQPGRSDFFTETTRLRKWLRHPDVGLALDPEWRVTGSEVPGKVIGSVSSREVNATTAWLDQLIAREQLPEKLVIIHQFTDDMVDDTQLKAREGLEIILNADGFGGQAVKKAKYHAFTRQAPGFDPGFKLFYREDLDLMTPRQVLRLRPPPDFVVYE
jgi:hypothetical protein